MQRIKQSLQSITLGALTLSTLPIMAMDAVSRFDLEGERTSYRVSAPSETASASKQNAYAPGAIHLRPVVWSHKNILLADAFDPHQTTHYLGGVRLNTAHFWLNKTSTQHVQGLVLTVVDNTITQADVIYTDLNALMAAPPTKGRTLFVAEQAIDGDGSLHKPFAKITDALSQARDGDTVYLLG